MLAVQSSCALLPKRLESQQATYQKPTLRASLFSHLHDDPCELYKSKVEDARLPNLTKHPHPHSRFAPTPTTSIFRRLLRMSLLALPNEILELIANFLTSQANVNSLVLMSRFFYVLLNQYLYWYNVQYNSCSALTWAVGCAGITTVRQILRDRKSVV